MPKTRRKLFEKRKAETKEFCRNMLDNYVNNKKILIECEVPISDQNTSKLLYRSQSQRITKEEKHNMIKSTGTDSKKYEISLNYLEKPKFISKSDMKTKIGSETVTYN